MVVNQKVKCYDDFIRLRTDKKEDHMLYKQREDFRGILDVKDELSHNGVKIKTKLVTPVFNRIVTKNNVMVPIYSH